MKRVPGYLDRYPAKMVSRLADDLIARHAADATVLCDPFCGSGAILKSASESGIAVVGCDINPVAVLLSRVKLEGCDADRTMSLAEDWVAEAETGCRTLPIEWPSKTYWFTQGTIRKLERLRAGAKRRKLYSTAEGRAALLSLVLSVRRCSKADQRSPKPFISRTAIETRAGKHFDPGQELLSILRLLCGLYGEPREAQSSIIRGDARRLGDLLGRGVKISHVVTSPPYINAQDYFRNFKLELHVLRGLLPFEIEGVRAHIIGTERGLHKGQTPSEWLSQHQEAMPWRANLLAHSPRLCNVVDKYFWDMDTVFGSLVQNVQPGGTFVLVCGDNLVGGMRIPTWDTLNGLVSSWGFEMKLQYGDFIARRNVPPMRMGHKGIIKEEIVSVFVKEGSGGGSGVAEAAGSHRK